ncbi:amino acid adenylation domain-containing protein [Actinomadura sp. DC4]|uniref:amino acid adenylation domain-containing protein n=1 Tax=Actinomadura sp. DC4 TaxID=3055069 RepID=UPI0025B1D2C2|nr:amino acid adenylation domain-containing protein [Actinomadura sp. DC4]MDN3356402.1 amino acid adenylation domain-containing protein [Actinomadura sp. DC4]
MLRLTATPEALAIHRRINRTTEPYPDDRGTAALFERQVARRPGATAVVHRGRTLSYRELNRRANALAARLRASGVVRGDTVGVCVARSPELVVALLAVLKCGAAYLPFDAAWPGERQRGILLAAGCEVVVTDRAGPPATRLRDHRVLAVRPDDPAGDDADPVSGAGPDDIAYVNFTSGSTGRPKGVPVRHRSVARLVHGARYARLDEHPTLLQLAPISFDAATFEIWGALLRGGTCVLYPSRHVRFSELRHVIEEHGITVVFLTTALFNVIVDDAPDTLAHVTTILTGGEAHSLRHMAAALRHYGDDRVVSVYGPTECTTFATYYPVRRLPPDETALPIGLPIQNTGLYLVDGDRLCAAGETGEICLAGPGLSPGYLGLPEATRERFVECELAGGRLYRTGDVGRLRVDGNVVFQGRLDDQVKINGYRVEPGEIRHHLDGHPDVKQSHVTVGRTSAGEKTLFAFVVPATEGCTPGALRRHLAARLPEYLVPAVIRLCASLPLSPTGKVDRQALLALHDQA